MSDAFEGIKEGLEDALAFAKGDRSRGRVVRGEWRVPTNSESKRSASVPARDADGGEDAS